MLIIAIYLVVTLHLLLSFTVVTCTLLSVFGILYRHRRIENLYLTLGLAVLTSQLLYGECILTVIEKRLRNTYVPGSAYHTSFLAHYLPRVPDVVYECIGPMLLLSGLLVVAYTRIFTQRSKRLITNGSR